MSTGAVWRKFVSSFQPEKNRQALGGNATSNDLPDSSSVRRNGKDSVCSPYKVPLRSTPEWRKGTCGHRARQAQGIAFRLQRDSPRAQIFPNPYASAFCYHLEKKARALLKGLTFIVAVLTEIIGRLLCVCALRAGTALGSTPCTYEICYTCWQNITTLGGIKDSLETSSALTLVCIRINTADVNAAGLW